MLLSPSFNYFSLDFVSNISSHGLSFQWNLLFPASFNYLSWSMRPSSASVLSIFWIVGRWSFLTCETLPKPTLFHSLKRVFFRTLSLFYRRQPMILGKVAPTFRLDFEWLVMQPLFSNLNGDHPSFRGSVSKEVEHDLKSTEADPLTLLLGICQATIGIKTLSSLLQVAMEWKLDQVKWACGSGRLIKVNSEISTWKLANWLVATAALFLSSKQRTSLKSLTTQHGLSTKLPRSLSSIQNSSFSIYLEGP